MIWDEGEEEEEKKRERERTKRRSKFEHVQTSVFFIQKKEKNFKERRTNDTKKTCTCQNRANV